MKKTTKIYLTFYLKTIQKNEDQPPQTPTISAPVELSGGTWKISTQTLQIVVSMAKIHLRHHKL